MGPKWPTMRSTMRCGPVMPICASMRFEVDSTPWVTAHSKRMNESTCPMSSGFDLLTLGILPPVYPRERLDATHPEGRRWGERRAALHDARQPIHAHAHDRTSRAISA